MAGGEPTMAEALERLDRALPEAVRVSLRPPASEEALEEVRAAVDPFELPDDVVTLWRWADGQTSLSEPWWPLMLSGVLCSAAAAASHYRWLCDEAGEGQWTPLWLPVAMAEHVQAGVEMITDRPGAVIDGDFGSGVLTVLAPSLAAVFDGTAQMLEAGVPFALPDDGDNAEWRARQRAILDAARGWERWSYDRMIGKSVNAWPRHWRAALGLLPQPDAPRRDPTPIASLPVDGRVTIEGHVTDRHLIDGTVAGPEVITVRDATGELRVSLRPDQPGRIWTMPLGLRVQVDTAASNEDPAPAEELRLGAQL